MWAAKKGNKAVVKTLLVRNADVNIKNKKGLTALKYATEKGHTEIVELLKQAGAKE
jgi:ankyrin repeat protein